MRTENGLGKESVLQWRGVLAEGGAPLRGALAAVLATTCMALAFTQVGFVGVQFADGDVAYLVVLLQPVALAAVLLGTLWGAGMGLFAGGMLFAHAALMPLDYYEHAFVTPLTYFVMITLCGLLLGAQLHVLGLGMTTACYYRHVRQAGSLLVRQPILKRGV